MTCICPSCGYNLDADKVVERDGWRIDPRVAEVEYLGKRHPLCISWVNILHCVCSRSGPVSAEALLNRISESGDVRVITTTISRVRRTLRCYGLPVPIAGIHRHYGGGYVWAG